MSGRKFKLFWYRIRQSVWFTAVWGLIPSFLISLAAAFKQQDSLLGDFFVNFIFTEGLVVFISLISKPILEIKQIFGKPGFLDIDNVESKILISRLKIDIPKNDHVKNFVYHYGKIRESWIKLFNITEAELNSQSINIEAMKNVERILNRAGQQIQSGPSEDIETLKQAACYLSIDEAKMINQINIINRIRPLEWFSPSMTLYLMELYRHSINHPRKPKTTRISIVDEEEYSLITNRSWQINHCLDFIKGFVALNQISGVELKIIIDSEFTVLIENFISKNLQRIKTIFPKFSSNDEKFLLDFAFIMYCEGENPRKTFRGRPYPSAQCREDKPIATTSFFEIDSPEEERLYFDLFQEINAEAYEIPTLNISHEKWY